MIKLFRSPLKNLVAITVLLLVIIVSCKKDGSTDENLTEAQRIANAKNWYQKTTAKIELKSSKKVENVTQQVSWADAKLYKQADGSEIIGVPVDIKLNNGTKTKGSYLLMISKTGNTYKPVISFNEKKNYFVENIVSAKIKDWYNDATKPNNSHTNTLLNNTNKGKVMVVEGGGMDCVQWFLTETYYDEEGNVIQYYEHYMYTICQALIDGGDGGGLPTDPEEDEWAVGAFEYSNESIATTTTESEEYDEMSKNVTAYIYIAKKGDLTARFKTFEKIKLYKFPLIGVWTFDEISHVSMTSEGSLGGLLIEPIVNYTTGSVYNPLGGTIKNRYNEAYAKMKYSFKDKQTKTVNGELQTHISLDKYGEKVWYYPDLGITSLEEW